MADVCIICRKGFRTCMCTLQEPDFCLEKETKENRSNEARVCHENFLKKEETNDFTSLSRMKVYQVFKR